MYLPEHFHETDLERIDGLIAAHPLAAIVAATARGLVANHIPLLRAGESHLIGHVALSNPMHEVVAEGSDVLAIFRGEDTYISPNWYPTKADHHRHVPTWNYQVVHVAGAIRFLRDDKSKRRVVGLLTRTLERRTNGDAAWRMADAPADFMQDKLDGIVAFEIEVKEVVAKAKLGQNKQARDFDNVAAEMEARGQHGLAARMRDWPARGD